MNNNYKHVLFILDDSGSMSDMVTDAIGGFNQFVENQQTYAKEEGLTIKLDTLIFGSPGTQNYLHRDLDIHKVTPLTRKEYNANSGATALLDTIGMGVTDLGSTLRDMPETDRPGEVIVQIFTDGYEKSSREYRLADIQQMIRTQTNTYSWDFVFMASDLDATQMASDMGIHHIAYSEKSGEGMRSVFDSTENFLKMARYEKQNANFQHIYNRVLREKKREKRKLDEQQRVEENADKK